MSWDTEHYIYKCSDGEHNSFWKTVVESPEWKAWEEEVSRRAHVGAHDNKGHWLGLPVFDVDECREAGWISDKHFAEFLKFVKQHEGKSSGIIST